MATGSILLTPGSAILPDGTTTNLAPAMQRAKSSGTAPAPYFLQLLYDAASEEWASWAFRMPADYASAPVLKVQFKMTSATSGDVVWAAQVAAVTDGDATDVDAKVFAVANTATVTVPGTVGYLKEASITIANADSLAAGDFVVVRLARQGAAAGDTATGDAEMVGAALTYTA
ncbi:hypothetical protein Drose_06190 [Dactylosporangium roseum]|uniref:Uncharacterized protein n=1 Tax=Dactylosporangium roseum TaxID=47989 RepID=A0ABY5Z7P1_9ACTN|nr:hypothetical protein [Dactylosporangium roseum]UWZ37862.1 hypothetical protein Drose_06190 [Dactylosporangium roseum]